MWAKIEGKILCILCFSRLPELILPRGSIAISAYKNPSQPKPEDTGMLSVYLAKNKYIKKIIIKEKILANICVILN
tara:strand:+ start:1724 stop:1951 length:228 start_codon:yes stop_codon:yes gene_type:complete